MSLVLALVPAAGWSSGKASEQRELQLNRRKWARCGITSYEIQIHEECFCPPPWSGPFRVSIRGGKVIKVVYEGQKADGYWPGRVVSKKDMTDLIMTVEDVFVRAEKVINSSGGFDAAIPKAPHKVHYDPEYGFPALIDVDNPPRLADAQWRLVIDEFRPAKR